MPRPGSFWPPVCLLVTRYSASLSCSCLRIEHGFLIGRFHCYYFWRRSLCLFQYQQALSLLWHQSQIQVRMAQDLKPRLFTPYSEQCLPRQAQALISLVPVVSYLFALSYIPLPSALPSSGILTTALSRLVVLGTALLGLLSGFGAVSNAWAFFPLFSRYRNPFTNILRMWLLLARIQPTEADIVSAEQSLAKIRNDLQDRKVKSHRQAIVQVTWPIKLLFTIPSVILAARTKNVVFSYGTIPPKRWWYVCQILLTSTL